MECSDITEIVIHDSGTRLASFMYYAGNIFKIGRDMGWGVAYTEIAGVLINNSEVQIKGTNVLNFGSDQTKVDSATGRIGYGTYEANSLCIVGGAVSGSRQITMWDNVKVTNNLQVNASITANTITANGSTFIIKF